MGNIDLRDLFAGFSLLAVLNTTDCLGEEVLELEGLDPDGVKEAARIFKRGRMAKWAYEMADKMVTEREERPGE